LNQDGIDKIDEKLSPLNWLCLNKEGCANMKEAGYPSWVPSLFDLIEIAQNGQMCSRKLAHRMSRD
ncbi:MAG: hypothetical protein AMJ37_02545, partial [Dehalococcoidia bacterium DG_18]